MYIAQRQFLPEQAVVRFADAASVALNVAGLPAAARAVRELAIAGVATCWLEVGESWRLGVSLCGEALRLAGKMSVHFSANELRNFDFGPCETLWLNGEAIVASLPGNPSLLLLAVDPGQSTINTSTAALDAAAQRILAVTGKPGDGLISRHFNRPLSRALSRELLRWPNVRPTHATCLTALAAAAMVVFLVFGGANGLIAGALLFQAASVIDGIDGEIARATFRCSATGAKFDSLVDAIANIGFISGLAINLWIAGNYQVALAALWGLAAMALGLFLIGQQAGRHGATFTFNAVKDHFRSSGSRLMQWLTWLTMRDFFAFAAVLFVISGFTSLGLIAFAVVASGWLMVVLGVMGVTGRKTA